MREVEFSPLLSSLFIASFAVLIRLRRESRPGKLQGGFGLFCRRDLAVRRIALAPGTIERLEGIVPRPVRPVSRIAPVRMHIAALNDDGSRLRHRASNYRSEAKRGEREPPAIV